MIATAGLLKFLPSIGKALLNPAVLAAIAGAALFFYGQKVGSDRCEARHQAAEIAERDRLAAANRFAKDDETVTIGDLLETIAALERQRKENEDASRDDPLASSCGLGADSVQRVDAIGRPKAGPRKGR